MCFDFLWHHGKLCHLAQMHDDVTTLRKRKSIFFYTTIVSARATNISLVVHPAIQRLVNGDISFIPIYFSNWWGGRSWS